MEGNKDEAEKCFHIAMNYLNNGNTSEALKYLYKSERLYPTKRIQAAIQKLLSSEKSSEKSGAFEAGEAASASGNAASGNEDEPETSDSAQSAPGAHGTEGKGRHSRKSGRNSESHDSQPKFTDEQMDAVKRIQKCKDYYEILGVSQDCSDDEMKKAYKKLALRFHPDKNHAPGATEAFKAIGNAFSVLSDPVKRKRYDQFGSEEEKSVHNHHSNYHEYDYTRGFEGDISAEELFNMFFGGGFHAAAATRRTFHQRTHFHRHPQNNENPYNGLVQLAPLLIVLVLSLLGSLLSSDPVYSLQSDSKYSTSRKTVNLKIPYYVKPDFSNTYKGDLRRLEQQIEEDHVNNLRSNCYRERMYKESVMWQARSYQDANMYEQAQSIQLPSCEALQKIYA